MLEGSYQQDLGVRRSLAPCLVQIPRSLQKLFEERRRIEAKLDERRRFIRFSSRGMVLLEIRGAIARTEAKAQFFTVVAIDLSRHGAAFLHGIQLFPGDTLVLWFPNGKAPCRVVRCAYHGSHCFEVGVVFDSGPLTAEWIREASVELLPELAGQT